MGQCEYVWLDREGYPRYAEGQRVLNDMRNRIFTSQFLSSSSRFVVAKNKRDVYHGTQEQNYAHTMDGMYVSHSHF